MADLSGNPSTFITQAYALLLKNIAFQKRNYRTNLILIAFPIVLCLLIFGLQKLANGILEEEKCGCACVKKNLNGTCEKSECGIKYSTDLQSRFCPMPSRVPKPPLLSLPLPEYRAVRTNSIPFTDLPDESCRTNYSCPLTVLLTGGNQSLARRLGFNLFNSTFDKVDPESSDVLDTLADLCLGTEEAGSDTFPSLYSPIYYIQPQCFPNSTFYVTVQGEAEPVNQEVKCLPSLHLWRKSSSRMKDEILKGYYQVNSENKINEIVAAYDFLNSNEKNFNVSVWHNSSSANSLSAPNENAPLVQPVVAYAPQLVNVVSNAFLHFLKGSHVKMQFEFVKDMPRPPLMEESFEKVMSMLNATFFTWAIMLLFPVMLTSLVYEKEQKLRMMMKMHGLGDSPYWMISYVYFFFLSSIYMLCLVGFGSFLEFKFFTANSYSIQFVFFFIYTNLQIVVAFLASAFFSTAMVATAIAYIFVLASGLIGLTLLQDMIQKATFPEWGLLLLEIIPSLSLYRGLYELGDYSTTPAGMQWRDLSTSGMREVLTIMIIEWIIFLPAAYYFDQVLSVGSGVSKHPLYFLKNFRNTAEKSVPHEEGEDISVHKKRDVSEERKKVEHLLNESDSDCAIICDNLRKIYPGEDGNPDKYAVRGLSLAIPRGECFGMLGPNGAGKSSSISMMIGLMTPSSGTTVVHGLDIRTDMDKIYSSMGVCPQFDLLWLSLTGREHLLFYGRLKNLRGAALTEAVETSLDGVNLLNGGLADKQAGMYSGGMKRRLSVAISLIGHPKVVYLDEPSTGLDPASRNLLWEVVKNAKDKCAVVLTTHSMEEAEALCDRLGIFVNGRLQCIGYPTELKARYGGTCVLTVTTSASHDKEVENIVYNLSRSAKKIYHISGTQKFEFHKSEVKVADVFHAIQKAKEKFTIQAWGLADTTLEDVFIKVALEALATA